MDCDSFVLNIRTQNTINDLKILKKLFDFSNLNKNRELLRNRNQTVVGDFEIETPEKNLIVWVQISKERDIFFSTWKKIFIS